MKELAFRGKIEGMIAAYMNCADCLFGISHKHFARGGALQMNNFIGANVLTKTQQKEK